MRDQIHLHIIVIILGFTAILGKLISLPALELTTVRMFIAAVGIFLVQAFIPTKGNRRISRKTFSLIMLTGFIVASHWATFFLSIKLSNVAVALSCFSTTTLFTSVLEPLIEKRKIWWVEIVIGLIIILGLSLIFSFELSYTNGIIIGIISAFLAAVFSVLNRQLVKEYDHYMISFYELAAGFVLLLSISMLNGTHIGFGDISSKDWMWLLILGVVCTTYAFTAVIELMKRLSAFNVNLAINLEPIYGIILAFLIFGDSEKMSTGFYIGALIMFSAVFIYPILKKRFKPSQE